MPDIVEYNIIPTLDDAIAVISAKVSYDQAAMGKSTKELSDWFNSNKDRFFECHPKGFAWRASPNGHAQAVRYATRKKLPVPSHSDSQYRALRYLILAVTIGWDDLVKELTVVLKHNPAAADRARAKGKDENSWCTEKSVIQQCADIWAKPDVANQIAKVIRQGRAPEKLKLTEAAEKHSTLNTKLFTKEDQLKEQVRNKMLEIVDEFITNLKDQDIDIKVDDVLLIGSNASYNYTNDSDIDLHILANSKAVSYSAEISNALYSAYRSLFNKRLDIKFFNIPVELFVEIEDTPRVSNGIYSVKKNKWIKKPVPEDIPEYDQEALDKLVSKWEVRYNKLINEIKADKLDNENKIIKLLENIYDQLRKKGVAKGEYSLENLAFKELRNKGYLDKLKDYRNELASKRLSLEERLDRQARLDSYTKLARAAGSQPIIQDNGIFFIYNLKASEIDRALRQIRQLPFVIEAQANESGKYDFSNPMELAMNKMPKKYYNIRGRIAY